MVKITDTMTKKEYNIALDEELEEERRKHGDESRIFEKGYDYRPHKVGIIRVPFSMAKIAQSIEMVVLEEYKERVKI